MYYVEGFSYAIFMTSDVFYFLTKYTIASRSLGGFLRVDFLFTDPW